MSEYQFGDRVNITIDGAQFQRAGKEGHGDVIVDVFQVAVHQADGTTYYLTLPAEWEGVTFERVGDWPPQPGDLWRDADGDLWLCRSWTTEQGTPTGLVCARGVAHKSGLFGGSLACERVKFKFGPLTLVHREEASDQ